MIKVRKELRKVQDIFCHSLTVTALKMNSGIRELYLADNGLDLHDAIQLGSLLRMNNHLQLLDIRYISIIKNVFLFFIDSLFFILSLESIRTLFRKIFRKNRRYISFFIFQLNFFIDLYEYFIFVKIGINHVLIG